MKIYWSNYLNCKRCGFTNTHFYMSRYAYKGDIRYAKTKICLDCTREVKKEYRKNYQRGQAFKNWRKKYIEGNREEIRKVNMINARNYRLRKKNIKHLNALRERMYWAVLK